MTRSQDIPYGFCQCGCGSKTEISPYKKTARSWVRGEPKPYLPGHRMRHHGPEYEVRDCGHATPCWVWSLRVDEHGYGRINRVGESPYAHRSYYEKSVGPIPDGLHLDHLCRNPSCVNPEHLEPVTHAENVRRGYESRRQMTAKSAANSSETT